MNYGSNYQSNLDRYMSEEGISHNSIAKKTGVSQKTVWSVVTGRSTPTLNTTGSGRCRWYRRQVLLGFRANGKAGGSVNAHRPNA